MLLLCLNPNLTFPNLLMTAGVDCPGSIIAEQIDETVALKCDCCRAVVGGMNAKILEALDQAITDRFVFHKFSEMDAPEVLTSISEECQRGECNRSEERRVGKECR